MLNIDTFRNTEINTNPFKYVVITNFVKKPFLDKARNDYPEVPGAGSHPPTDLEIKGGFKSLMDQLLGEEFKNVIQDKFNVNLQNKPVMYTVRGFCRAKDGKIHTDSKTKIITVLLYMNDDNWPNDSGRLRLLNNGIDIEDYFDEIEPQGGTLLAFKRADNSWHGHHSFEGKRRAIQINWVTNEKVVDREQGRHGFSTKLKKFFNK